MKWHLNGVFVMKWGWVNGRIMMHFFTDHRNIVCPMLCFDVWKAFWLLFCFECKLRTFFCNSMLLVCVHVPFSLLALCYSRLLLQNWGSGEWDVFLWVGRVCHAVHNWSVFTCVSGQWCRAWYCFGDAGQSAVMTWCYQLSSCSYYTAYGESMFVFVCSVCSCTSMHELSNQTSKE